MSHSKEQHRKKEEARRESIEHLHGNVIDHRRGKGHDAHRHDEISQEMEYSEGRAMQPERGTQ
jgi:hypothetical protein